jgi:hypothetical protein
MNRRTSQGIGVKNAALCAAHGMDRCIRAGQHATCGGHSLPPYYVALADSASD